jgi:hypothetical protein
MIPLTAFRFWEAYGLRKPGEPTSAAPLRMYVCARWDRYI